MRALFAPAVLLAAAVGSCACPAPTTTEAPAPGGGTDPGTEPTPPTPSTPPTNETPGDRTPAISAGDPHYARVEGASLKNDCQGDQQCFTGGCSGEICTAEQGVSGTCEIPEKGWPSQGASCGCLQGQCVWYRSGTTEQQTPGSGSGSGTGSGGGLPAQGEKCGAGDACGSGLTCRKYYGIAGPRGPEFKTCEIPCGQGTSCPTGQSCVTIADGPGQVCRP